MSYFILFSLGAFFSLRWCGSAPFFLFSVHCVLICVPLQAIQGESIELEFQVVSGGALDVDYTLANPSGHIIERKSRVQDHLYEATASQTGDHRICLVRRGGGGGGW